MAKLAPDQFRQRLAKALKVGGNGYGPEDIAQAVKEGRMQAWTRNDSLVVTEVIMRPKVNAINIVLAAGVMEDVLALQEDMMAFGREHGCTVMRMEGRKGWAKVLPGEGWKKNDHVIFERAL